MHSRNKHCGQYDFKRLVEAYPDLAAFVTTNKYGNKSIDFFDPTAVKTLNKAILMLHYGVEYWEIPDGYLCPPIPGRADYIHHMSELLATYNNGKTPRGKKIICLDIGMGANCIYPIIGVKEYGWSFIGTDVDATAIDSAKKIVAENNFLKGKVEIRKQKRPENIFYGIFKKDEIVDFSICNPPFYASLDDSKKAFQKKIKNLKKGKIKKIEPNFGGQNHELWCDGGEADFVSRMILESGLFPTSCFWFSTLVSKKSNLKVIYEKLKEVKAVEVKTIEMGQGNKISRIVAWTLLNKKQQGAWAAYRWKK